MLVSHLGSSVIMSPISCLSIVYENVKHAVIWKPVTLLMLKLCKIIDELITNTGGEAWW